MTANNLISSDQIEGYPHPKTAEKLFGHQFEEQEFLNLENSMKTVVGIIQGKVIFYLGKGIYLEKHSKNQ